MIIDALTGTQTYNGSQARFFASWIPTKDKKCAGMKECPLYVAADQKRNQCAKIKSAKQTALIGMDADLGEYFESRFDMPEGTIIKVSAFSQEAGGLRKTGNHYLRVREGAALRMVKFDLPNNHGKSRFPYAYVRGHFDYLTAGEAEHYGVKTNPNFIKSFTKSRFKMCFEDLVVEPEATAKTSLAPVTVEVGGKQEEVMMFEKVRKIRSR